MQATRSFLLGVTAAVLLAGCGSAASSSAGGVTAASGSAPASAPASQAAGGGATASLTCALAPAAMVSSDLGVTGLGAPKQVANSEGAACLYSSPTGVVTLNMFNGATAAKMSAEQQTLAKAEQTTPLTGLGDEAFSGTISAGSGVPSPTTLVAREGSVELMVVSPAGVGAETSLEKQLFTKIG